MSPLVDIRAGRTTTVPTGYEATDLIGTGAFSEVYKAFDTFHKTDVALKIYHGTDPEAFVRAKGEETILKQLSALATDLFPEPRGLRKFRKVGAIHPMLPLELGEYISEDGTRRIISLNEIIPNSKDCLNFIDQIPGLWESTIIVGLIIDLCDAICIMHKESIIHRDLKPSNILLKKPRGHRNVKPFIIDFNISGRSGGESWKGGTERYLPPEVRTGQRQEPDFADDLWALSAIIWEMLFGLGQSFKKEVSPHKQISFEVPADLIKVLLKALGAEPQGRYLTSQDFYHAVTKAVSPQVTRGRDDDEGLPEAMMSENLVTDDDRVWARENRSRILDEMRYSLAGDYELPISKEMKDKVSFLYSSMLREETHSFNLKQDLLQLGSKAIPEIIEESYKIPVENQTFNEVVNALAELALQNDKLAKRAIKTYCVSSDFVVRKICFCLCDAIRFFPDNLIYNILEDDALYLPQERVDIADLCIRFSEDESVLFALTKYMSREYILDRSGEKYFDLKEKIACRLNELKFENKTRAIVDDACMRIWEELPEYENLDPNLRNKVDHGLLELFADAFAATTEEALNLVKIAKLPTKCEKGILPIAMVFLKKLTQTYRPAREWLFEKLRNSADRDLYKLASRLGKLSPTEKGVLDEVRTKRGIGTTTVLPVEEAFELFLKNGWGAKYLRENGEQTLDIVERVIGDQSSEIISERIIRLLDFFRSRLRRRIVTILIDNWPLLASADYKQAVFVLTEYGMPDDATRSIAVDLLSKDMGTPLRCEVARDGIEKILR